MKLGAFLACALPAAAFLQASTSQGDICTLADEECNSVAQQQQLIKAKRLLAEESSLIQVQMNLDQMDQRQFPGMDMFMPMPNLNKIFKKPSIADMIKTEQGQKTIAEMPPKFLREFLHKEDGIMFMKNNFGAEINYEGQFELDVRKPSEINKMVYQFLMLVAVATVVGLLIDGVCVCSKGWPQDRPRVWSVFMLLSSYAVLIPGWIEPLISFVIGVRALGYYIPVMKDDHNMAKPMKESTLGLVKWLHHSGSDLGAFLIVLYAIVIPIAKLVCLMLGEAWRKSENDALRSASGKMIRFVQFISKWATPDAFAYVLLYYLMRTVGEADHIITNECLEVAFGCYCIFCVFSTISSLAIPEPEKSADSAGHGPPIMVRMLGLRGILLFCVLCCVGFYVFLNIGLDKSIMSIELNIEKAGSHMKIGQGGMGLITKLGILGEGISAQVTTRDCISQLWDWARKDNLGSSAGVGFIMFTVFMIGFTVLDMILLFVSSVQMCRDAKADSAEDTEAGMYPTRHYWPMKLAKMAGHLSMLDVALMGIWVFTSVVKAYEKWGVHLAIENGFFLLLIAEAFHYAAYFAVASAAEFVDTAIPPKAPKALGVPHY